MTFYITGTGNTAWFLATRLVKSGHTCMGVYGRNIVHATELADAVGAPSLDNLSDIKDDADASILAITDHAIGEVAANFSFKHTVLIHTAGSVSRTVLEPFAENAGIMWPIYSLVKDNLPKHNNVPVAVTGNNAYTDHVLQQLVSSVTDISYTVSWEQRQWLHLCAVLCNNFTNHMMAVSEEICHSQHIPFSLLYPIISQTAERVSHASPRVLQTGPAKRGDTITIEKHLQLLQQNHDWQELYKALTASIDKMYNVNKEE